MKEIILEQLKKIEADHDIKILFASESGSRGWGFPSPDSDWDVRFIYIRHTEWYLSLEDSDDFINIPIDDELDINGWDLKKALKLLAKSNPVVAEWLQSPIIYFNKDLVKESLLNYARQYYSLRSGVHHYLGITNKRYHSINEFPEVKLKNYFYILRSVLSAFWIVQKQEIPPMEFHTLRSIIDKEIILNKEIDKLLILKEKSVESETIPPSDVLNAFIKKTIEYCEEEGQKLEKKQFDVAVLNHYFIKMVSQYDN